MTHQVGKFLTACGLFVLVAGCAMRDEGARAKGDEGGQPNRRHVTRELPPVLADDAATQEVIFPLTNDSEVEVHLGEPIRSCSCTNAVLDKTTLQPGDSASLTLTLQLKGRRGAQRFACLVKPDSGEPWQCEISTYIYQRIRFSPDYVNAGEVPGGSKTIAAVLEERAPAGEAIPPLEEIHANAAWLAVSEAGQSVERRTGGVVERDTRFVVTVSGENQRAGGYFGEVAAKYIARDGSKQKRILPVSWRMPAAWEVSPVRVLYGEVKREGGPVKKIVTVKRPDGGKVRDVVVAPSKEYAALTLTQAVSPDEKELRIEVQLDPRKVVGETFQAEFLVRGDGSETGAVAVPVLASVRDERESR